MNEEGRLKLEKGQGREKIKDKRKESGSYLRDSGIKRGPGLKKKKTKEDINLLFVTKDSFGTKMEDGKKYRKKSRKKI